jgi:hypothetical protein
LKLQLLKLKLFESRAKPLDRYLDACLKERSSS